MAKNITLMGASYTDVPAVVLPQTGGGTASFTDVTDTTATASDVAEGKRFFAADGTEQTGTAVMGGGSDEDFKAFIGRSTTNPTLPSDLTTIGEYAFYNYTKLALTSLPDGLTSIGSFAFQKCSSLALTSLPDNVLEIGGGAFQYCKGITSLSGNCRITTFGSAAFNGNSTNRMQLAHVSFPNMAVASLSTVFGSSTENNACQLLEDADIGNTSGIAANAFANCNKLQTLILRKTGSICTLANVNAFLNTPMRGYNSLSGTIYVPSALISTYQTATNWSTIYGEGHVTFAAIEGSEYEL